MVHELGEQDFKVINNIGFLFVLLGEEDYDVLVSFGEIAQMDKSV